MLRQENDVGRGAHGRVLAREGEFARLPAHAISRDAIGALVTAIQKVTCGIDGKASRVITSGPFLASVSQFSVVADGEPDDAVVQAVGPVNEFCVRRNPDFRAEIGSDAAFGKSRDHLFLSQAATGFVVVEGNHSGAFFLDAIEPAVVRMEYEMPWAVSRGD